MAMTTIICKSVVLEFNMRDHRERFVESTTENSCLRYLSYNMCIQGTWADALIVQAVADKLHVSIQIVETNPGFSPITTTVNLVQERNSLSTITIHCRSY